jgi:hypothetical protein
MGIEALPSPSTMGLASRRKSTDSVLTVRLRNGMLRAFRRLVKGAAGAHDPSLCLAKIGSLGVTQYKGTAANSQTSLYQVTSGGLESQPFSGSIPTPLPPRNRAVPPRSCGDAEPPASLKKNRSGRVTRASKPPGGAFS